MELMKQEEELLKQGGEFINNILMKILNKE